MSEGDQCLSNGLCYYPGGEYMFRGGCSDKNWNSPNCFQHCKNTTNSYSDSYDRIVQCGGDRYCCYSDGSTCCNDDSKVFTLGSPTVIKDLATSTTGFAIASPTGATPTSISFTSFSRTAHTEASLEGTASKPTNTAASATPSSTSTTSNSTSNSDTGSHTFSRTAIIAASVAGIIAFIVIVALFWFFIRRHYRKKLATGGKEQSFPMSSDGFHKLPDKSPRPVEVPAPLHSPAPPYQPPAYQTAPYTLNGAVEIDNSYLPPQRNQWGQPVFEAPAQPYRQV
ncbi:hypothetical protein IQ07DRAFT_588474 [Pyrenochaeta sp. DS3sAY3a]|nr:hypothetical protein IQ07DRAFT_588474 [Pyrenochaeta sp. DS3sAY3a]